MGCYLGLSYQLGTGYKSCYSNGRKQLCIHQILKRFKIKTLQIYLVLMAKVGNHFGLLINQADSFHCFNIVKSTFLKYKPINKVMSLNMQILIYHKHVNGRFSFGLTLNFLEMVIITSVNYIVTDVLSQKASANTTTKSFNAPSKDNEAKWNLICK